ncbi:unnamed protein product [Protopolystoma xenopodis]|uniref:Uncharacterized protein n=1 Tax=Protopolystoma xenopodis TaxID=117903 RepID=A0A448WK05_9PLAT|nr:unnamed protein product [Protopolystoma xenopodis]
MSISHRNTYNALRHRSDAELRETLRQKFSDNLKHRRQEFVNRLRCLNQASLCDSKADESSEDLSLGSDLDHEMLQVRRKLLSVLMEEAQVCTILFSALSVYITLVTHSELLFIITVFYKA